MYFDPQEFRMYPFVFHNVYARKRWAVHRKKLVWRYRWGGTASFIPFLTAFSRLYSYVRANPIFAPTRTRGAIAENEGNSIYRADISRFTARRTFGRCIDFWVNGALTCDTTFRIVDAMHAGVAKLPSSGLRWGERIDSGISVSTTRGIVSLKGD